MHVEFTLWLLYNKYYPLRFRRKPDNTRASVHKYNKPCTIPSDFFNDIYLCTPVQSLTSRHISEGKANIAFSKWAEDTESEILEDIQEVRFSVRTAPADTAQNGWMCCYPSIVLNLSYMLASLPELSTNPKAQAALQIN